MMRGKTHHFNGKENVMESALFFWSCRLGHEERVGATGSVARFFDEILDFFIQRMWNFLLVHELFGLLAANLLFDFQWEASQECDPFRVWFSLGRLHWISSKKRWEMVYVFLFDSCIVMRLRLSENSISGSITHAHKALCSLC